MTDKKYNVLFLCTGNSARSIMAESILRKDGGDRFNAFSAGAIPRARSIRSPSRFSKATAIRPIGSRSKPWDEFAGEDAPKLDFVFTVCDNAAGEVCPVWPGQPMTAHWGIEDPAAVEGTALEKERAFVLAFRYLRNRISIFNALPIKSLDRLALSAKLREIGETEGASRGAKAHA